MFDKLLSHPLTRGLDLDDPETTALRAEIVRTKGFLRKIYLEWYQLLAEEIPEGPGDVLELGSGGGFARSVIPGIITSDVFPVPGIDRTIDAARLPFESGELKAVLMTNVFHHLPRVATFVDEASRCVRPGGVVTMIEPWVTPFSSWVYRRFHHEPFDPDAGWEVEGEGPLSSSNQALPWIVLDRDRVQFAQQFPQWRVERTQPFMPFRYLLSGGISLRSLMPSSTFGLWSALERRMPGLGFWSLFAHITLRRTGDDDRELGLVATD